MKKHRFKPKTIKLDKPIVQTMTTCGICRKGLWEGHKEVFRKNLLDIQVDNENCPIKKFSDDNDVDMWSNVEGQRVIIKEIKSKINELIEWINKHEEEI